MTEARNTKKRLSALVLFIIIGAALLSMVVWSPMEFLKKLTKAPLERGTAAPLFELETVAGEKIALTDFKGKPVLLKFWKKG